MFMSTKTITVTEDSYSMLKSAKREDESFSELIKRLFAPKADVMQYAGMITEGEAKEMKRSIRELREASVKRLRER